MAEKRENTKLLALARERFNLAAEAESELRKLALEDLKFRRGEQWPEEIMRQRREDQRPCLTINQMPQFIRQITNDQRQNRPAIQVNPVSDGADDDTAKVFEGLIRSIWNEGGDVAIDTAFQTAVTSGFGGYFRFNTEYADPMSFDQEIRVKRVRNGFSVYFDPACQEQDYSDAMFAFVVERLSKEEFKEQFPDAKLSEMNEWTSEGDGWISKDECRVAEYFFREAKEVTIELLSDGSVREASETAPKLAKGVTVMRKRKTQMHQVKWVKMTGDEVLEETDWAGRWIPIVPVLGDELDVDGERVLEGIVRQAKDPQRQYNFMSSATTETIALAPKAPFVGAAGQFEGFEQDYQRANTANMPFLQYMPVSLNGTPAPPPQRQSANPAIEATTQAMMQSSQDLKAVTGIYQAALGAQGNETSGKGILARQQQSHGANFHFVDNLSRSLKHAGRILVDLIPKIYDTERVLRIIGEDGRQSTVKLMPGAAEAGIKPGTQPMTAEQQEMGEAAERIHDVTVGRYDVTVNTGPSYQTKRQEAVASQMQLVTSFPAIMPVAGDIMVRNMDWPGAEEIADRMEKMLPAQLQEQDEPNAMPPQVQQQVAQLTQQNQQMAAALQKATEELKDKTNLKAMELESKERIEFEKLSFERDQRIPLDYEKLRVQMVVADLNSKAAAAQLAMKLEMDRVQQQGEQAHEYAMQQDDQANQQQVMQQQAQQAQGQQQQEGQQQEEADGQQVQQPAGEGNGGS